MFVELADQSKVWAARPRRHPNCRIGRDAGPSRCRRSCVCWRRPMPPPAWAGSERSCAGKACTRRRVGPGNFTPSLSQIPDVNLSILPARVTARRLPPSAEPSGSSRYDPVGPSSTAMTCPLRSTGITPLRRYYEAVRPSPAHRYFRPRGWSRLCLFPWHRRPGSHVPYKSQIEFRAAYMPDAAWAVSVHHSGPVLHGGLFLWLSARIESEDIGV